MRLNKIQKAAVTALEDIKATDITPLDTRTLTSLYDAIIVATAESPRQTKALARNVANDVRAAGGYVRGIEGEDSGEWVIVDCGELVVHIMLPQTRVLYNLEELWTPVSTSSKGSVDKIVTKKNSQMATAPNKNKASTGVVVASKRTPDAVSEKQRSAANSSSSGGTAAKVSVSKTLVSGASHSQNGAGAKAPVVKRAVAKPTVKSAAKPAVKKPAAKKPAAKKPAAKKPAAKKPAVKKPAAKKPTSKAPVAKKPAAKRPAAKKPTVKKAVAKKPASKKPAVKKTSRN